jgi:hypothetical protein
MIIHPIIIIIKFKFKLQKADKIRIFLSANPRASSGGPWAVYLANGPMFYGEKMSLLLVRFVYALG